MSELEILKAFEKFMSIKHFYTDPIRWIAYKIMTFIFTICEYLEKFFSFFINNMNLANNDQVKKIIAVVLGSSVAVMGLFYVLYWIKIKTNPEYNKTEIFKNITKLVFTILVFPTIMGYILGIPGALYKELSGVNGNISIVSNIYKNSFHDLRKYDNEEFKNKPGKTDPNNFTVEQLKDLRINDIVKKGKTSIVNKKIATNDKGDLEVTDLDSSIINPLGDEYYYRWHFDFFTPTVAYIVIGIFFYFVVVAFIQIGFKTLVEYIFMYFKAPSLIYNSKYVDESMQNIINGILAESCLVICYVAYTIATNVWNVSLQPIAEKQLGTIGSFFAWIIYLFAGGMGLLSTTEGMLGKLGYRVRFSAPRDIRNHVKDLKKGAEKVASAGKSGVDKIKSSLGIPTNTGSYGNNGYKNSGNNKSFSNKGNGFTGNRNNGSFKSKGEFKGKHVPWSEQNANKDASTNLNNNSDNMNNSSTNMNSNLNNENNTPNNQNIDKGTQDYLNNKFGNQSNGSFNNSKGDIKSYKSDFKNDRTSFKENSKNNTNGTQNTNTGSNTSKYNDSINSKNIDNGLNSSKSHNLNDNNKKSNGIDSYKGSNDNLNNDMGEIRSFKDNSVDKDFRMPGINTNHSDINRSYNVDEFANNNSDISRSYIVDDEKGISGTDIRGSFHITENDHGLNENNNAPRRRRVMKDE